MENNKHNTKYDVYTLEKVNTVAEPLFFGNARNTQRYDKNNFNFLSNLSMTIQRQMWFPEEVKLQKDRLDKETFTEVEDFVYSEQLSRLVFLDSLQGRSPLLTFGQLTTNPEFEACLLEQEYQESRLHSRTYSYMVENIYTDPDIIFNNIWENKVLLKAAKTTIREPNKLYDSIIDYLYHTKHNIEITDDQFEELLEDIIKAIVSMNILEGIHFYPGFAAVWSITEFCGKMAGSSRLLQFIQRDEKQHLALTQYLFNSLKKHTLFEKVVKKLNTWIYDAYFEAQEESFEWADHLFSKGNLPGMNADISKQYTKYLINQRLLAIGLKPINKDVITNPIKWTNKYINLHNVETSLQESEAVDYVSDPIQEEPITKDERLQLINNLLKE
jgi:ribonucleoside-diphosphate reductase beta chain